MLFNYLLSSLIFSVSQHGMTSESMWHLHVTDVSHGKFPILFFIFLYFMCKYPLKFCTYVQIVP